MSEEQKTRAVETLKRNKKIREEQKQNINKFCNVLLLLMQSDKITDIQKARFAEIYAKANYLI